MIIYKDFEAQQNIISDILVRALEFLYQKGKTGNWKDIRGHSLAMWALIECGENPDSPLIQSAKDWLIRQIRKENKVISWESEVWDTALSIIALLKSKVKPDENRISNARNWLLSLRNDDWNWHYEPWETSLALLAFLESRPDEKQLVWISRSVDWLIRLQEKGDAKSEIEGQLISFHYTAFLILILGRLKEIHPEWYDLNRTKYQNSVTLASNFLISYVKAKGIWTKECWSNGYILLALTKYHKETSFDFGDERLNTVIIQWFKESEKNIVSGADIEDTALAVLGMWSLFLERQVFRRLLVVDKSKNEDTIRKGCMFDEFRRFTSLVSKKKLDLEKKIIRVNQDGSIELFISKRNKTIFLGIMSVIVLLSGWIAASEKVMSFIQKIINTLLKALS
ncbi:MAG: terpene cyclase/mutase family protein [candidate division Zixibacteria bacterium]|nr:terpene cyclase/mutase family protein [candidate division Zixibacteria bacterium]